MQVIIISGCKVAGHECAKFMIPNKQKQIYSSAPQMPLTHLIMRQLFTTFSSYAPLSKIIINTYREDSQLFIDGSILYSQEGTPHGDPLAMAMYAIAIIPLIYQLEDHGIKQAWYADEATADGLLNCLKGWWDHIVELGPDYGYFPNVVET